MHMFRVYLYDPDWASGLNLFAMWRTVGNRPMEDHMLDYWILKPEGVLVLKPHSPLRKEDFAGLSSVVDAYLSDHTKLHGVLVQIGRAHV